MPVSDSLEERARSAAFKMFAMDRMERMMVVFDALRALREECAQVAFRRDVATHCDCPEDREDIHDEILNVGEPDGSERPRRDK